MSTLTFEALIDGVRYDPKKGALKIQLIAASHVSMDKLTTLAPSDESIKITLESAQTKIVGDSVALSLEANAILKEEEKRLKEANEEIAEREEAEGEIVTEFPLSEAKGDKEDDFLKKEEEID